MNNKWYIYYTASDRNDRGHRIWVLENGNADPTQETGTDISRMVVMLSATDRQEDINKCYQAGASSYLVKPINFDDLRKLLETICFYWIDLNKVAGKIPEVVSGI